MTDLTQALKDAQEAVTRQGDAVRSLKASVKDGKAEKVHAPRSTPVSRISPVEAHV